MDGAFHNMPLTQTDNTDLYSPRMNYNEYDSDDFLLDDQFLAYCVGSSPEAVAFWEKWQSGNPPNLAAFRQAQQLYAVLSGQKPRLDDALLELEAMIDERSVVVRPLPVARPLMGQWWVVAASVVLISLLGAVGYWFWAGQYVIYQTAYNQQRRVTLPDGSTVTLNSHSMLKHRRAAFMGGARTVELSGEGFFSVQHQASNAPFRVVTSGPFDVQVLGTEFTVLSRPNHNRIVLKTGRVAVQLHDQRPSVTLRPGQLAELDSQQVALRLRSVKPEHYNAWMEHRLVFDNATLADVVQTVEEQFGVRVKLWNISTEQTFTGVLPMNRPETVLNALAELKRLKLRKTNGVFVLSQ